MREMAFSQSSGATLLIALAVGYLVCYFANREEKILRTLGYTIGIFIILVSTLLILGKILWKVQIYGCMKGMKAPGQHQMMMRQQGKMPMSMPEQPQK